MTKKIIRGLVVFFLLVLFLTTTAAPALAFDARSGTNVTIGSGEVVNGDLYLSGTNIKIDGTVNGDVFGFGQNISINGTVNGGVTLAGQDITVNGKVSTGARLAGQTVTINGNIGRDLVVVGSIVNINEAVVIGGDLNIICNTATINGHIAGNVRGSANQATISGAIDRDVNLTVSTLTVANTARVGGNLTYISQNKADIQSGATIAGTTNQVLPSTTREQGRGRGIMAGILAAILLRIFGFLAIFIIGLIFIFTATPKIKLLALSLARHPASSLGWGALIFFVTPIAAFVVMFTIIGIPLGILSLVVWGILLYLSQIPVALIIGWLILSRGRETASHGFLVGAFALGLFLLYVVTAIPIFGWIIWLFAMIFGLGTLVSVMRRTPEKRPLDGG